RLTDELIKNPNLFSEYDDGIDYRNEFKIGDIISELSKEIAKPVITSLTIEEEMERNRKIAVNSDIKTIKLIAEDILMSMNFESSSDLSFEQLEKFGYLVRFNTWSPGDRDSKAHMTEEKLAEGIRLNAREAGIVYIKLLQGLKNNIDSLELGKDIKLSTKTKINDIINTINHTNPSEHEEYYDYKAMLTDLKELRKINGIKELKSNSHSPLTDIDSIIIQAHNIGNTVRKSQVRENHEIHRSCYEIIINELKNKLELGITENFTVENFLDRFLSDKNEDNQFKYSVTSFVETKLDAIKKKSGNGVSLDDLAQDRVSKDEFNFYHAMEALKVAVKSPDKAPHVIIAECADKDDMLKSFALLKIMEKDFASVGADKVAIISLTEYPDKVMQGTDGKIPCVEMMKEVMSNTHFKKHHEEIQSNRNLLRNYSLEKNNTETLTIAEAKKIHGIKPKEGDDKKYLKLAKIVMFAGSDVTRAGSSAAAAAVKDASEKTIEAMLDMGILPIIYKGVGSSIARSAVANEPIQTDSQGRALRTDHRKRADEITKVHTENIKDIINASNDNEDNKKLGRIITLEDSKILARTNLGNVANLPENPDMWKEQTKERTYSMIRKYNEELFEDADFKELMSYTANPFVKEASAFAARTEERNKLKNDEQAIFPPAVNTKKMRAIGFQGALNASGICASLFYGGSSYLKEIKSKDIKQMYLYDPRAQDTINRMTYGVLLADMDLAWKYQGLDTAPSTEELTRLANSEATTKEEKATRSLAKIHLEYNEVANKLLKLHRSVCNIPTIGADLEGKAAAQEIMKTLPIALREEMETSLANIEKPRNDLADLFQRVCSGEISPNDFKRGTDIYRDTVYPNMVAIEEVIERAPMAYSNPYWALEVEKRRGRGQSIAA
ncbi:MAG: hypothetical protein WCJ33_02285, partial [Pseudomonadota bacterium]